MSQYNLIIFPRAEERIDSVIDFLLIEWGFQSQQKFMAELKYCFKIIENKSFLIYCFRVLCLDDFFIQKKIIVA